jgi:hypothetical protein
MTIQNKARRLAAAKLLRTRNFRSSFRASLRDQIVAWLETSEGLRRFDSPLSQRQWEILVDGRIEVEAKRLSESSYWDRNYNGVPEKKAA